MLKLTEYASFIDNFHNIFLCKLPKNIKIMFLDQFLRHLKNSPILALNNCHTYTKVLYYAVKQSPKLTNYSIYPYAEYKTYSHRIIEEVSKLNSILSFAVMSN
jgi:arginine deiminase